MKALIENIDEQIKAHTNAINYMRWRIDSGRAWHIDYLMNQVEFRQKETATLEGLKQLALAEQERIINELKDNDSHDYYANVAMETAIKIVRGENKQ